MRLRLYRLLVLVLTMSVMAGHAIQVQAQRRAGKRAASRQFLSGTPRIAVLPFQKVGVVNEEDMWSWPNGIAQTVVQDVFVTELKKIGRLQVVEREQLQALMGEKNLTLWGDHSSSAAVKIGKLLGVNYLLTGSVGTSGGSDKSAREFRGKRKTRGSGSAKLAGVVVKARLIDTSTGEIIWADEAKSSSGLDVNVGGFGGGVDDNRRAYKVIGPLVRKLLGGIRSALH